MLMKCKEGKQMRNKQVDKFMADLDCLINKYRYEETMSYYEVIGCLTSQVQDLINEEKEE